MAVVSVVLVKLKATLPALRSQNLIAAVEPPGPFRHILKFMNIDIDIVSVIKSFFTCS